MHGNAKDLTGQRFGRLVVEREYENKYVNGKKRTSVMWICSCDCGKKEVIKSSSNLRPNSSCGCLKYEKSVESGHNKKLYNNYDLSGEYGIGYTLKGEEFYFDLEDYDKIKEHCWHITTQGYVRTNIQLSDNKRGALFFHNIVMNNEFSYQHMVDHIGGLETRNDNRKYNLRIVNNSKNQMNTKLRRDNSSGVKGVNWCNTNNTWIARIQVNGSRIYLGEFKNFEDAVKTRKEAEKKFFGEYSYKIYKE